MSRRSRQWLSMTEDEMLDALRAIRNAGEAGQPLAERVMGKAMELHPRQVPQLWELFLAGDSGTVAEELTVNTYVCGKPWSQNDIVVKCLTCQSDHTCAICADCFDESLHVGHDWRMIQSGGGMCDCGDATAWNPKGFCKKHRGIGPEEDPTEGVPDVILAHCRSVIGSVCSAMHKAASCIIAEDEKTHEAYGGPAKALIHLTDALASLISHGQIIIGRVAAEHLMSKVSTSDYKDSVHYALCQASFIDEAPPKLTESLSTLYVSLMTDFHMKEMFALQYIRDVLQIVGHSSTAKDAGWVSHLSVQVLTVPYVVEKLREPDEATCNPGLYHAFTEAVCTLLQSDVEPIQGYQGIQFSIGGLSTSSHLRHSETGRRPMCDICAKVVVDLCYCIKTHAEDAWYCLSNKTVLERICMHLLLLQQGFCSYRRDSDVSCVEDTQHELFLTGLITNLREGVTCSNNVTEVQAVLETIYRFISAFTSDTLTSRDIEPSLSWLHVNDIYNNSSHGCYFQLPVHRLLSIVAARALVHYPEATLQDLLPSDLVKKVSASAEHPLLLTLTRAQVVAGMWKRNHMRIATHTEIARMSAASYFLNSDLFTLQMEAAVGPTAATVHLAHRYSAHQKLIPDHTDKSLELEHVVLDHFLRQVLIMATDRSRSETDDQLLRADVLHLLATGPKKFSSLTESVAGLRLMDDGESDCANNLEDLARSVATSKQTPEGVVFSLKDEAWVDVNPYKIEWEETQLMGADAEYAKAKHKDGRVVVPCKTPSKPGRGLSPVIGMLHNEVTLSLVLGTINRAAYKSTPEGAVRKALDILLLALRTRSDYAEAFPLISRAENAFYASRRPLEGVAAVLPVALSQFTEKADSDDGLATPVDVVDVLIGTVRVGPTGEEKCPIELITACMDHNPKELGPAIKDILGLVKESSEEGAKVVEKFEAVLSPKTDEVVDAASKARKAKGKAKQRQALKQMQQQQTALLLEASSDEEDADDGPEVKVDYHTELDVKWQEDELCSFCSMSVSPYGTTDTGLVALATTGKGLASCAKSDCPTPEPPQKRSKYTHQDKPTTNAFAEVFPSDAGNVIVHTCGHIVHIDCLESHIKQLKDNAGIKRLWGHTPYNTDFKGVNVLHIPAHEYLCPLCGRIANTICPIMAPATSEPKGKLRQEELPRMMATDAEEDDLTRPDDDVEDLFKAVTLDPDLCGEERLHRGADAAFLHTVQSFSDTISKNLFPETSQVAGSSLVVWAQQDGSARPNGEIMSAALRANRVTDL